MNGRGETTTAIIHQAPHHIESVPGPGPDRRPKPATGRSRTSGRYRSRCAEASAPNDRAAGGSPRQNDPAHQAHPRATSPRRQQRSPEQHHLLRTASSGVLGFLKAVEGFMDHDQQVVEPQPRSANPATAAEEKERHELHQQHTQIPLIGQRRGCRGLRGQRHRPTDHLHPRHG